jgi:hypothetical protein
MSHEITAIDRQQGLVQAWHKLTEVLPVIDLKTCFLSKWDVSKSPMLHADGSKSDYCELICTDDAKIRIQCAPVNCDTYQPITNERFLGVVADAIQGIQGAKVASVGSVCERGRVFVSVELKELPAFQAAGREFKPYLNFLTSHDQSCAFIVNTSNVCTVCNNTFGMNLRVLDGQRSGLNAAKAAKSVRIKFKHTKNVGDRLDNVPEIVDGFLGAQAEFRAIMDTLAAKPVSKNEVEPLFAGFIGASADGELGSRKRNQVDRLANLFYRGAGNMGANRADAFSAVTDYYTHESSGGEIGRQIASSEYGFGQNAKARAFELLQDDAQVSALVRTGTVLLNN